MYPMYIHRLTFDKKSLIHKSHSLCVLKNYEVLVVFSKYKIHFRRLCDIKKIYSRYIFTWRDISS